MHLWIDATAGVAGDMLLGSLIDAGADLNAIQLAIDAVAPGSIELRREQVIKEGQSATQVHVTSLVDDPPHRNWSTIRTMLEQAELADQTRSRALKVFERIAIAEAAMHGMDVEDVHFHEVGALDSIADVVGVCEAVRLLGVDSVSASDIALGFGRVRGAHGDMPVPAPAVARLALGWPSVDGALPGGQTPGELATPTGVALVRELAGEEHVAGVPAGVMQAVGYGAGTKNTPGRANVVRAVIVEKRESAGELLQIEANIDDLDPRLWPGVLAALLEAGARDAWLTPILMKKGRPAHTVHALCDASAAPAVRETLFRHTTTLGVRYFPVQREVLERSFDEVVVDGQRIAVKVGSRGGEVLNRQPEFEDVARAARELGVSEAEILRRVR
ncbi:nickel pincer cofactor biosynthesis protein LarC [Corynebacterium tapiri]|uniref:Pyridinium-3,5-bisthiocarboxylic acid mononucleotide nickel insertion protein n=1 Tax=Corynebacterium tapiri TaxID=1448266 RepID=A0A5C4U2J7_9CORY|nr:nickel pincer cofactor biosynthesis protein LarC [Corynebacterium tapiri]TNL95086.1 nickel pincer cofactor biosynthesis protein LarC [Corynebacterium tapiri]